MDYIQVGEALNSIKYQADTISYLATSARQSDFIFKETVIARARRIIELAEAIPEEMWGKDKTYLKYTGEGNE